MNAPLLPEFKASGKKRWRRRHRRGGRKRTVGVGREGDGAHERGRKLKEGKRGSSWEKGETCYRCVCVSSGEGGGAWVRNVKERRRRVMGKRGNTRRLPAVSSSDGTKTNQITVAKRKTTSVSWFHWPESHWTERLNHPASCSSSDIIISIMSKFLFNSR